MDSHAKHGQSFGLVQVSAVFFRESRREWHSLHSPKGLLGKPY